LFFKYSIERGLITPTMRVVLGTVVGIGSLIGSRWLRPRGYPYPAAALAGGGIVVLYGAFWAAHALYGLIGLVPSLVLMMLVTTAACLLAVADTSLIIAVLGLVGGFATPLLLSSGADRPIGLFGYVLLLDLGLLTVGYKRNWPALGLLSLAGTILFEALWIGARMGPDRLFLGLIILGVFTLLYVAAGRFAPERLTQGKWVWNQAAAVLFPFAFALYFAGRVDLAPQLYPVAILLALLSIAAGWLARAQGPPALAAGAAAASIAVVAVWLFQHPIDAASAWELVAVSVGLSLVFHVFVELDRETTRLDGPSGAALIAASGSFVLLLVAAILATGVAPWPWLAGWFALAALLYRQASFPERARLQTAAAVLLGLGLSAVHFVQYADSAFPGNAAYLAVLVGTAVVVQSVAFFRKDKERRRWADRGAAALPVILLFMLGLSPWGRDLGTPVAMGTSLLLGVLVLFAATRLQSGAWYAAAGAATAFVHWIATMPQDPPSATTGLLLQLAAVLVFTAWVFMGRSAFGASRVACYAAALAGPIWFLPMKYLYETAFGDATIGLLPVVLGAVSLAAVAYARGFWPEGTSDRLRGLVWFSATALGFLSVAIPLQLDKEWITIGWALEGLAVTLLWKRLDHPGLKYFGLFLLGAVAVRLVANPVLIEYHPRSGIRIFNWLLYTYIVPAAALLGSAYVLRPLEVSRWRDREREFYKRPYPFGAIGTSLAALLVVFVWINLAIADWFATGSTLTLSFGSTPAQRLTLSIAWAVYALVLLGLGMNRDLVLLRWISLAFLLVTIVKVFLYDLGHLQDLYRVASLGGLAVSLIFVSPLYQRFVLRSSRNTPS